MLKGYIGQIDKSMHAVCEGVAYVARAIAGSKGFAIVPAFGRGMPDTKNEAIKAAFVAKNGGRFRGMRWYIC